MKQLLGRKVGMTRIFDEKGRETPVTVIEVQPNVVIGHRTEDRDGYNAVIVGTNDYGKKRVPRQIAGQFPEGVTPKRVIRELAQEQEFEDGQTIDSGIFEPGDQVKVTGTSKGRGFAGVVKRHGFHGGPNTHGSMNHRRPGSTGQSAWPSRVIKGKKGAGRMGGEHRTVKGVRVVEVDPERNLLVLSGAVPGSRGGLICISTDERYEA
jgi:large subunit ribosomal protein L3